MGVLCRLRNLIPMEAKFLFTFEVVFPLNRNEPGDAIKTTRHRFFDNETIGQFDNWRLPPIKTNKLVSEYFKKHVTQ